MKKNKPHDNLCLGSSLCSHLWLIWEFIYQLACCRAKIVLLGEVDSKSVPESLHVKSITALSVPWFHNGSSVYRKWFHKILTSVLAKHRDDVPRRMWPQRCAWKLHFDPCLSCTDKQNEQVFLHSCRPAIESSAYLGIWQPSLNQSWWNRICSHGTQCECSLWSLPLKYGIENSCVLAPLQPPQQPRCMHIPSPPHQLSHACC